MWPRFEPYKCASNAKRLTRQSTQQFVCWPLKHHLETKTKGALFAFNTFNGDTCVPGIILHGKNLFRIVHKCGLLWKLIVGSPRWDQFSRMRFHLQLEHFPFPVNRLYNPSSWTVWNHYRAIGFQHRSLVLLTSKIVTLKITNIINMRCLQ